MTTCSEGTRVLPQQTCNGDFGQYPGDSWDESSELIGRENQETESIVHKLTLATQGYSPEMYLLLIPATQSFSFPFAIHNHARTINCTADPVKSRKCFKSLLPYLLTSWSLVYLLICFPFPSRSLIC